jgi:TonB family protein
MRLVRNKVAVFAAILPAFLLPVYGVTFPTQDHTQKPDDSTQPGSTGAAKSPDGKSRPQRIRIGGDVQAAKIIYRVQPQYPKKARQQGITGTVRLHVVVGTNGSVQEVSPISGDPLLADAAADAVRQWKYEITTLNKVPVEVDTVVDITFSLKS